MRGECRRAFVPIAGLHHAARDRAAGFCVFNDCGVAIEQLKRAGLKRIAYVDIDAHHGDGVFYAFEDDAAVIFADLHEDGRYLYPGTGCAGETGRGAAAGTKLNVPLPPGAGRCGVRAPSGRGARAPGELRAGVRASCSAAPTASRATRSRTCASRRACTARAARELCELADRLGHGRVLALGGGGYNRGNLAQAWSAVVREPAGAA